MCTAALVTGCGGSELSLASTCRQYFALDSSTRVDQLNRLGMDAGWKGAGNPMGVATFEAGCGQNPDATVGDMMGVSTKTAAPEVGPEADDSQPTGQAVGAAGLPELPDCRAIGELLHPARADVSSEPLGTPQPVDEDWIYSPGLDANRACVWFENGSNAVLLYVYVRQRKAQGNHTSWIEDFVGTAAGAPEGWESASEPVTGPQPWADDFDVRWTEHGIPRPDFTSAFLAYSVYFHRTADTLYELGCGNEYVADCTKDNMVVVAKALEPVTV